MRPQERRDLCRYLCGMRESQGVVGALQYRITGLREPCQHKLSDRHEPRSTVGAPIQDGLTDPPRVLGTETPSKQCRCIGGEEGAGISFNLRGFLMLFPQTGCALTGAR